MAEQKGVMAPHCSFLLALRGDKSWPGFGLEAMLTLIICWREGCFLGVRGCATRHYDKTGTLNVAEEYILRERVRWSGWSVAAKS